MGTCCMKKKPKFSEPEKEERRKKAVEAAEDRRSKENMKGISKQTHIEMEMKKKRMNEAQKNHVMGEKQLEWKCN